MRTGIARVAAHLGVFVVAVVATTVFVRWADTWGYRDRVRTKLVHVATAEPPYDVLFLGSSRMRRAVIPESFDARMGELGRPTHSFNLGVGGMLPYDVDALLRWVLALRPRGLRFVVIELSNHSVEPGDGNWMSAQSVAWHTPEELLPTLRTLAATPLDLAERSRIAWFHVVHTASNVFRVGQGPRIVQEWVHPELDPTPAESWILDGRGWAPMESNESQRMIAGHREFLARRDWFERDAVPAVELGAHSAPTRRFDESTFRAQVRRVRAVGIEPIFVVLPDLYDRIEPGHEGIDALAREVPIVAFDRPSRFESLYRFENFFDPVHLNSSGAKILTDQLADRIEPIVRMDDARRSASGSGR
ncbi:MAG: hypothetical protein KDB80_08675 [Planctomycetes bacterium]|nr:hypothetical protein [Planctomycetota bacterium]